MEKSQNQNKPQDNEISTAQWKQATMKTSFNTRKLAQHNKISTLQWKQATTQQNYYKKIKKATKQQK